MDWKPSSRMSLTTFEKVSLGFCFIFPLVYTRGPSCVVYYTKFTLYYISLTFISTVCLPLTLFRPRDTRNLLWPGLFLKCTARLLGLKWITWYVIVQSIYVAGKIRFLNFMSLEWLKINSNQPTMLREF